MLWNLFGHARKVDERIANIALQVPYGYDTVEHVYLELAPVVAPGDLDRVTREVLAAMWTLKIPFRDLLELARCGLIR